MGGGGLWYSYIDQLIRCLLFPVGLYPRARQFPSVIPGEEGLSCELPTANTFGSWGKGGFSLEGWGLRKHHSI